VPPEENLTQRNAFGWISTYSLIPKKTLASAQKLQPTPNSTLPRTSETLKSTLPSDGIRHLGVYISMDGNSTAETKVLFQ